jgi:hypothetical protein
MKKPKSSATKMESDQLKEIATELLSPCHNRNIPLWLVLLDNIPTLILFILGAMLVYQLSVIGSMIFAFYSVFSVVWFWAKICPYCHHYNTLACPCGYGMISAKIYKKRENKSFKKVFKQNIGIVFPNWFVPFAVAIYLLLTRYTTEILILSVAFSITGFVIIPLISKLVGCKNCEIKEDCPWMTGIKKE